VPGPAAGQRHHPPGQAGGAIYAVGGECGHPIKLQGKQKTLPPPARKVYGKLPAGCDPDRAAHAYRHLVSLTGPT
jgi:hypothetical protein